MPTTNPINQARSIALGIVAAAEMFCKGMELLRLSVEQKNGPAFAWDAANIEAMIAAEPKLQHMTSFQLNGIQTAIGALYTAMTAGGAVAANTLNIFEACRPGTGNGTV